MLFDMKGSLRDFYTFNSFELQPFALVVNFRSSSLRVYSAGYNHAYDLSDFDALPFLCSCKIFRSDLHTAPLGSVVYVSCCCICIVLEAKIPLRLGSLINVFWFVSDL